MAEDLNSCHRQGDACGCYSVNGTARSVIVVAIGIGIGMGMGVRPILAGGRSLPDPASPLFSSGVLESSVPGWWLIAEC
eukprot:scaffold131450_cov40-Attheya_sp.AAC.1